MNSENQKYKTVKTLVCLADFFCKMLRVITSAEGAKIYKIKLKFDDFLKRNCVCVH